MVVDWCHLEEALAVCKLEIANLKNNGNCFHYVDDTNCYNCKRSIDSESHTCHSAAEEERACIAHKYSCREFVIEIESEETAEKCECKSHRHSHTCLCADCVYCDEEECNNHCYGCCKTVDAVCKVNCVYDAHDSENRKAEEERPADRNCYLDEWEEDFRLDIAEVSEHCNKDCRRANLEKELLNRCETCILLLLDFCHIVDRADDAENESESRHDEIDGIKAYVTCDDHSRRNCNEDGDDENPAAHCRCILL